MDRGEDPALRALAGVEALGAAGTLERRELFAAVEELTNGWECAGRALRRFDGACLLLGVVVGLHDGIAHMTTRLIRRYKIHQGPCCHGFIDMQISFC